MNNSWYVGGKAKSVTTGTKLPPISKVILNGDNDAVFEVGDDSGYILETYVPTATQQMAQDIYNKAHGFTYQGIIVNSAFVPPEVELGDGFTAKGVYGMVAQKEFSFTPKLSETISAPYVSEEDHEYQYTGTVQKDLDNKVQLGKLYYGTRITRKNGIEIVKTDGNIEKSRAILNSDQLAFYNDNGDEAFYFDAPTGVFRITHHANIEDALEGSQAFSSMELNLDQFEVQLGDVEGNVSNLQVTARGLQNQITAANGNITTLSNTVDGFESTFATKTGVTNQITNSINGIGLSVSNGKSSSSIQLTNNGVAIGSSQTIKFTGKVVFESDLANGITSIDGGCIDSGTISSDYLKLYGPLSVYEERQARNLSGFIGYVEGRAYNESGNIRTTYGIGVMAPGDASNPDDIANGDINYYGGSVVCTNSGARLTYGTDMFGKTTTIACVGDHCYSSQQMEVFSDRRLKSNIEYNILEKYKDFYKNLRPCRFKMNNNNSNGDKYLIGFIAQDVKESLEASKLEMSDFSGLSQFQPEEPGTEGYYALRYNEFTAMNVAMIQDLLQRVETLETRLKGENNNG